jgi:phage shock protein A
MLSLFKTLVNGAAAQAEEKLESKYSIELIRQKNREAQSAVNDAKGVLVSLIQRQKVEARQLDTLKGRIKTMTAQAKEALKNEREDLASEAAQTIAHMENEQRMRQQTVARLDGRIVRLQGRVEHMNRRLVDLKQGEIAAVAMRKEASAQTRLNKTIGAASSFNEAEDLIHRVMNEDDPFERAEIMEGIDAGLSGANIETRLHDAGFGNSGKTSGADVLARLKS